MELPITTVAGWLLLVASILSAGYELWRAIARTGVGPNDRMADWLRGLPIYVGSLVTSGLLILGWEYALIPGLAYAVLAAAASIFWYGPSILPGRRPGVVDWFEDRVFTILVGTVAMLLVLDVLGVTLVA